LTPEEHTDHYEPPKNGFRTFLIIWATQSISVFGSALTFFAVTIWLTQVLYPRPEQKPELAFAISAVSLMFALPTVFIAPLAGAWADRHDRKRTMMVADALSGLLSLILLALIVTNVLNIWILMPLVALFATTGAFHGAAFDTSYAMIVPEKQLPRANGMMQTIWSLSGILSPIIAATIIALPALARQGALTANLNSALAGMKDGTPIAIAIDAVTFFLASATLIFLYVPSPKRTDIGEGKPKKSIWADVREGITYIWRRRTLLWLLGTFTVANFVGTPVGVLEPLIMKFNLATSWQAMHLEFAQALSVLAAAGGFGGLAGGLFISAWGGLKRKRVYGVLVPMVVAAVAEIVFGLSAALYLTAAMGFVMSAMIPIMNSHSQTIWQTQTPRELQGRVFSVRRVIAQFTWPLGTALAGLFGGLFDPGMVIAVLGALFLMFCIAQFFNPYMLKVEDKEAIEQMAAAREEQPTKVHPSEERETLEVA